MPFSLLNETAGRSSPNSSSSRVDVTGAGEATGRGAPGEEREGREAGGDSSVSSGGLMIRERCIVEREENKWLEEWKELASDNHAA